MIPPAAYKQPHHVMLFFEEKKTNTNYELCMAERINYYENLKRDGKVVMSGNFWNQERNFIIVHVNSDTELEHIVDNDPGVRQDVFELLRAMPF